MPPSTSPGAAAPRGRAVRPGGSRPLAAVHGGRGARGEPRRADRRLRAARDAFYRGDLAAAMVRYHPSNGGWLTAQDLEAYHSEIEPPALDPFRGIEVLSAARGARGRSCSRCCPCSPPTICRARPQYAGLRPSRRRGMKLCFADRERYYGDPRFVEVPMEALLAPAYAERAAATHARARMSEMPPAGRIPGSKGGDRAAEPAAPGGGDTGGRRYVVRLRRRSSRQRLLGDAERLVVGRPGDSRLGLCRLDAGIAVLGGAGAASCVAPGKRPRLTPNPAMRIRAAAMRHAVRRAGRRSPAAGHAAGLAEPHGVRHGHPGGGRGAAVRHPQLPGIVRASPVLPGPARPRAAHRRGDGRGPERARPSRGMAA